MAQPFFSIITICRNEARDIHLTADSVVNQTYKNYEWLVIDGASTDGTLNILAKYKKNMAYFVSEKDGGIYDAMNKGIKKATGKYLIFMNGGDLLYDKNVLQKVYDFIKKDNEANAIYHGECYAHLNDIKNIQPYYHRRHIYKHRTATPLGLYIESLPHQCCFIKRELFIKYGPYDIAYPIYADREWFIRTKKENNIFMEFFVAIQNTEDWVYRQSIPGIKKSMAKELKKIRRQHYHLLQILLYDAILLPSSLYNNMSFLHKPWRAFKKIIGINKK